MLQNIRDNSQSLIAKIIVGLIVVIFAAAGVESLLGGGGVSAAAEVNGEEITVAELEQAVRIQKSRLIESMGENADLSMLDDGLIQKAALEQLVQQKLMLQAAQEHGVAASPMAIDQLIVSMPQFQENGQFSPQLYENVLRSNGYSMAYFKQLLSDDVLIRQLSTGIAASEFVTEQEFAQAAAIIGQKRSFQYLTLAIKDQLANTELSEEQLQAYYDEHIDQYMREPKNKLAYIEVKQADFVKPVTEEEVKQAYELELADFQSGEERKVSHILVEITGERDEQAAVAYASELKAKIDAGNDFAAVAEASSEDAGSAFVGGDLGYTNGEAFPEDFEAAVASAELNKVSEPVVTEAGVHLILVTDIKSLDMPSFEEKKATIQQRLELQNAEVEFVKQVDQLRDLVFNSADLKEPANELGLEVKTSDWVGRADNAGVLSNPRVQKAAFSDEVLKDRNNSEVIELANDHFIVIRVLDHKPAEAKPLAEVKAQIAANLKKAKASEVLQAQANEYLAKLKSGELSLEQLQQDQSLTVKSEHDVSRITAKAPRDLSAAIFAMAKPSGEQPTLATHTLRNGDQVIVSLSSVVDGKADELSAGEQQAVKAQLLRANSGKSISAYQKSIKTRAEITLL